MLVIKFFALLSSLQLHLANGDDESIIIVAIPQTSSKKSASWERGEEILPGAVVASKSINNNSQLNTSLTLLVIDNGQVPSSGYSYSWDVMKTIANLTSQERLGRVAGIAGVLHPNVLLALKSFHIPIASFVHYSGLPYISNVFYMTASASVVADSIAALVEYFSIDTMGLITDTYHWYYNRVSNQLSKAAKIHVSLYIQIGQQSHDSLSKITTRLSRSTVKLIFLSTNPSVSIQVLCEAYKAGLKWPMYAWILLGFPFSGEYQHANDNCSTQEVLEGIIILKLAQAKSDIMHNSSSGNPFAYVLHDAIWKLTVAVTTANHSLYSQQNGPSYPKVYFYQVFNGTLSPSGVYENESQSLTNVTLDTVIIDHPMVPTLLPLHYLMILPILCCVFNTVLLVLFFCFHNEPDVKSTAVSLSLLMFIGCYLLVIYIVVVLVGEYLDFDLCLASLSGLSICVTLILATVLVKMLRVYRVFTLHGYERPSIFLYNCALFIYTLLIIVPKVLILILWSSIDTYRRKDFNFIDSSGFSVVRRQCSSKHTLVWTMLFVVYDIALSVAVVSIAIKTRRVRFAQFKDTKKVNLMVFLVLFVIVSAWLYWYMFTATGLYHLISTYILYAGSIIIAFICQFTLFVPKVWTPLCNRLQSLWV